ncbi:hypothetical protein H5410_003202 [Solanum commersonii]|uniref:Reverse transcriptase zinc-binding domain-containing protein n=1 Tax=Solanum commersonii TaxID=4109 RepID=A0A9J6B410_SOLCO|nr:hypothetical protein H5410_003202 [Solanum commersonii]
MSDHRLVLLENGDWEDNPSYFKFENMWLQEEGFLGKINEWWQNYSIRVSPDFFLSQKLKCLKRDITDWNKEIFGKMETRKRKALDELMAIEQAIENRLPSQAEKENMVLTMELQQSLRQKKCHGGKNPCVYGLRRYGIEGNSLWKEVVATKHAKQFSTRGRGWKHIHKYWEDFIQQISFKVGNGLNVKFWKDRWLGIFILKEVYPILFPIARDPDSTVAQNKEDNQWNLLFRRNFNYWELGSLCELMGRLEGYNMNPQAPDIIYWGRKAKEYTVKKGYKLLHAQNDITDLWPWKLIWKTKLPTKNACFTLDNLCRRNFKLESAESVNHFFLHCAVAADIWHMFLSLFSLNLVMPQTFREKGINSVLMEFQLLTIHSKLNSCSAACMTLELVESGKHFIATIINGSDQVPTFSTDSVLPTPISQNLPSMPNVIAGMDKEGNTKASKITGLKEIITNLQKGYPKGGLLHHDVHENLHTDPKKDHRDSATTSHQTTQENQHNQLIHQGKVSGQGHSKHNDQQGNLNTSHNTQKRNQKKSRKKEFSLERIGTKHPR